MEEKEAPKGIGRKWELRKTTTAVIASSSHTGDPLEKTLTSARDKQQEGAESG